MTNQSGKVGPLLQVVGSGIVGIAMLGSRAWPALTGGWFGHCRDCNVGIAGMARSYRWLVRALSGLLMLGSRAWPAPTVVLFPIVGAGHARE